jgi:hypothetical protein
MGAYENPIAVINTESAKIFANAISNIGKTVSGVLDQEAQRKSKAKEEERQWLDWTFKYTNENLDKVYDQLQTVGVNNTEAFNAFKPLIDMKTSFGIQAKRAKTQEEQNELLSLAAKYEKGIRSGINIQRAFQENDAMFNKEFIENIDKVGREGGVPLVGGKNKEYNLGMSIRAGINPGTEKFYFDEEKGNWRVRYSGPEIKKMLKQDSIDMDASVFSSYDPGTIPEISKNIIKLFDQKTDQNPKGLGFIGKDNELSNQFIDVENVKYIYSKDGKTKTPIYPAKTELMTAQATTMLEAQAKGLLKAGDQAQLVWQNILSDSNEPLKPGAGSISVYEPKSEIEFIEAYVKKGLESMPKMKQGEPIPNEIKTTGPTKEGAAQVKIKEKAKNITDDILRANSKKNTGFFVGKTVDGQKIESARWDGSNLILKTYKDVGDKRIPDEMIYNMNTIESVENILADFIKERYGKDASSENIRDEAIQMLRDIQASEKPKINTSYKSYK